MSQTTVALEIAPLACADTALQDKRTAQTHAVITPRQALDVLVWYCQPSPDT